MEWKEDLESRLARRGAGRGHGGVRDAQHRSAHHRRRGAGRQAGPRRGPHALRPRLLRRRHARERRGPGRARATARLLRGQGVHGLLDRHAAGGRRRGRARRCCAASAAAPPSTPRTKRAWPSAGPWRRTGDWTSHPEVRDAETALRSTAAAGRHRRAAGQAGPRAARDHRRGDRVPGRHKDVASVEVTPQHLTLAAPEAYERLKGLGADEPADPRRARTARACGAGIADGVVDVLGSDHAPHTLEEKARPYPASPSGMPGVQTLVPVMLTHVAEGRLTLERFVDLTSAGAAAHLRHRRQGPPGGGLGRRPDHRRPEGPPHHPPRRHGHPRRLDPVRRHGGQGLADGDDHPRPGGDARRRAGRAEARASRSGSWKTSGPADEGIGHERRRRTDRDA